MSQTVRDALDDINTLLDAYKLYEKYFGYVGSIAVLIIGAVLTMAIGEAWALLLILFAALPVYLGSRASAGAPSEKELSEAICQRMSICVNEAEGRGAVLSYGLNGNEKLYEDFVKHFPHMESYKLRKLASVKIGL
jgi:hypothetical protein